MKESGVVTSETDLASKLGRMVPATRVNGRKTRPTVKESSPLSMEIAMLAIGLKTRQTDLVSICI